MHKYSTNPPPTWLDLSHRKLDLEAAYQQLLRYREALPNPPLLVVCDIDHLHSLQTPDQVTQAAARPILGLNKFAGCSPILFQVLPSVL